VVWHLHITLLHNNSGSTYNNNNNNTITEHTSTHEYEDTHNTDKDCHP